MSLNNGLMFCLATTIRGKKLTRAVVPPSVRRRLLCFDSIAFPGLGMTKCDQVTRIVDRAEPFCRVLDSNSNP